MVAITRGESITARTAATAATAAAAVDPFPSRLLFASLCRVLVWNSVFVWLCMCVLLVFSGHRSCSLSGDLWSKPLFAFCLCFLSQPCRTTLHYTTLIIIMAILLIQKRPILKGHSGLLLSLPPLPPNGDPCEPGRLSEVWKTKKFFSWEKTTYLEERKNGQNRPNGLMGKGKGRKGDGKWRRQRRGDRAHILCSSSSRCWLFRSPEEPEKLILGPVFLLPRDLCLGKEHSTELSESECAWSCCTLCCMCVGKKTEKNGCCEVKKAEHKVK